MTSEEDVVQHRQVLEQLDVLEGPGNSQFGNAVGFHAQETVTAEADRTLLRVVDAVETIEDRGLACSVWPDDGE